MCNLSGYCGTRQAAPILLDMIKKQEGFAGGYYTGISTFYDDNIYYEKIVGDTKKLIENTNAASLLGTTGIIHSRSKSDGGREWAHPFIGKKNGVNEIAYIANGKSGIFPVETDVCKDVITQLHTKKISMAKSKSYNNNYPQLPDGMRVHMSDVMCQLILSNMDDGFSEEKAMENAFVTIPAEIVGLMLSKKRPDSIFYSRINKPMFVSLASHGVYLSSSPTAFPDDAGEPFLLPALSFGCIKKDEVVISFYKNFDEEVIGADSYMKQKIYECVKTLIKEGPKTIKQLREKIEKFFETGKCNQTEAEIYLALTSLKKQGKIKFETIRCDGVFSDCDAPKTIIHYND